jgi:hypothetical protein
MATRLCALGSETLVTGRYPKLVFTDEGTTPDVQRTLDLRKRKREPPA